MREIVEILKNIKSKNTLELKAALELEIEALKKAQKEVNEYLIKLIAENRYGEMGKITQQLEPIAKIVEEKEELLEKFNIPDEDLEYELQRDFEEIAEPENLIKEEEKMELKRGVGYSLDVDFTNWKPAYFIIEGQKINAKEWNELLIGVADYLANKNFEIFDNIVQKELMKGAKRIYFKRTKDNMFSPKPLNVVKGYAETNLSAQRICIIVKDLLKIYEIDKKEVVIFLGKKRNGK